MTERRQQIEYCRFQVSRTMGYLFLLGLFVRYLFLIQKESLWLDEALTGWRTEGLSTIFEYGKSDPPLFYLLVWFSRQVFGDGPMGLRFPSLLAGALLGPTIYYLIRRRLGHNSAVAAALLGVFSSCSIRYSIEAHCYALATWLALVHVGLLWMLCRDKGSPSGRYLTFFCLSGIALEYTHNWGLLMMAGSFVTAVCAMSLDPGARTRLLVPLAKCYAGMAMVYVFYVPTLLKATVETSEMGPLWPQIPVSAMIHSILGAVLVGEYSEISAFCATGAVALTSLASHWKEERAFWGWTLIFTLGAAALLQSSFPIFVNNRYDTVFLGSFLMAFGFACEQVQGKLKRVAWSIVFCATLYGLTSLATGQAESQTGKIADLIENDRAGLTLVAAHRRFDPILSVPLAYEFGVLRGIKPPIIETPEFVPLKYEYIYIPSLYREGPRLQSIPPDALQQRVAEVTGPVGRLAIVGLPEEVMLLSRGLQGRWKLRSESRFESRREGSVVYILLDKVGE